MEIGVGGGRGARRRRKEAGDPLQQNKEPHTKEVGKWVHTLMHKAANTYTKTHDTAHKGDGGIQPRSVI